MATDVHSTPVLEAFDYRKRIQRAPDHEKNLADAERVEFWADTCREATRFRIGSKAVQELYREHGCLFYEPSHQQIHEILQALDAALPTWDRDYPHLFYETIRANFPDLVRSP